MDYKFLKDFSVCFQLENIEKDEEAFLPLSINFWYQILKNQMVLKIFSPEMILTRCSDMIAKKNSLFTIISNSLWSAVNVPLIFSF